MASQALATDPACADPGKISIVPRAMDATSFSVVRLRISRPSQSAGFKRVSGLRISHARNHISLIN
jgi:hypothetical protein